MYKTIAVTYADGNAGELPCLANAATVIRYRQVFGKDLLKSMSVLIKSIISTPESIRAIMKYQNAEITDENIPPELMPALVDIISSGELGMVSELAYIMNCQAQDQMDGAAQSRMSVEKYIVWLEKFDSMTFLKGAMDFLNLYINNKAGTSDPKKEDAQLTEK